MAMTINTLKIQEPTSGRIYQLADIADIDKYYAPRRPGKIDFLLINNLVPQAIIEKALRNSYLCNASRVYESQASELYQILMAFKDVTYQDENQTTYHLISTGTDATHGAYATTPDLMSKRRFLRAAQTCAQVGLCEFDTIRNITGNFNVSSMINPNNVAGKYPEMQENIFAPFGTYPNAQYEYSDRPFSGTENGFNSKESGIGYRFDVSKVVPTSTEDKPYNLSVLPLIIC